MNSLSLIKAHSSGNDNGCRLDCLPYDILISILQSPVLDLHSIMLLVEIWPHYDQLVMHVLQHYHLPRLYVQSAMDQEGKRRYHSWFRFHHLDVINRRVTFIVQQQQQPGGGGIAKRYISNTSTAARPHLRYIALQHTYHNSRPSPLTSSSSPSSADRLHFLGDEKSCSAYSSSSTLSIKCTTNKPTLLSSDLPNESNTMGTNMIQPHPLSLKHGFHTLSARSCRQYQQKKKKHGQRTSVTMETSSKEPWQFSYHVGYTNDNSTEQDVMHSNKDNKSRKKPPPHRFKSEHMYLSPICLTVSLSTLRSSCSLFEKPSITNKPTDPPTWFEKYIKPKLSFL